MRGALISLVAFSLLTVSWADTAKPKTELRNHKQSERAYKAALDFVRAGDTEKATELLDQAVKLDPRNVSALTARELLRQNQVQQDVAKANLYLETSQSDRAIAELRRALAIDAENPAVQAALTSALSQEGAGSGVVKIRYRDADEVHLEPKYTPRDFHYRGDSRGLLQQVWEGYGIRPLIDSSVQSKQLRFDLDAADFATATITAGEMTRTFYVPISADQALIVGDTAENRKNFERLALRTFYIGDAASVQEINDAVAMLRQIFDFKFIAPAAGSNQITIRAPLSLLDAATRILNDLYSGKPQVMLELNIFQVESTLARDIGIGVPTQFTLFNVNTEAQKLLSGSNQSLINQLISSGAINQANSSSIAALLAGLAAGGSNSILNQPIATFGGGITRSGVIIPGTTGHLSLNESSFKSLEHVTLRAAQSDAATFRDGTRYPILNASFAPIFNTPAISGVLANRSFTAPFPSFSYEDLGLTLKATPSIHGTQYVSLKLEFQLRGLGAAQLNGVPVITNREYNGTIGVPLGETAVLAGMVTRSEQLTLQGLPGLSQLPVLGGLTSVRNKQTDDAELFVTIRPYLVRDALHNPESGTAFVPPPTQ
ncbi:MAG: hypothetical protein JOZ44_18090 [Acidobacteria bacterium]|nr:hypothetical protein [Acidobacteriota bacterium]